MLRFALSLAAVRYNFVPFLVLCVAVSLVVPHGFLVLSVALFHVELCLFLACFLLLLLLLLSLSLSLSLAAYGRTDSDVITKTKFSRIDRFPYFLIHSASSARLGRAGIRCYLPTTDISLILPNKKVFKSSGS